MYTYTTETFSAALEVLDGFIHFPLWNYKSTGDALSVYLALFPFRMHGY